MLSFVKKTFIGLHFDKLWYGNNSLTDATVHEQTRPDPKLSYGD